MREHELELIAALAEGSLEDESQARALVDSSTEHRREYEAQLLAIESLRSAGVARMSESERSRLRRDVWAGLKSETARGAPGVPWYYRWAPIAAGLLVVVGVVTVLAQMGGEEAATRDLTEAAGAPSTTAADTAEAPAGGESGEPTADDGGVATPLDARSTLLYAGEAERLRESGGESTAFAAEQDDSVANELSECLADAGLTGYRAVGTIDDPASEAMTTTSAEAFLPIIAAIPEGEELPAATIAFVDRRTCELVYLDG